MTDEIISTNTDRGGFANIVYVLTLIGPFTCGMFSIIAVIMAYAAKSGAPDWVQTHYNNAINIFWKSIAFAILGVLFAITVIGIPVAILLALYAVIWLIVRCVKGFQGISRGEAYANTGSWGF
jgi:uncharacterized membrane protein